MCEIIFQKSSSCIKHKLRYRHSMQFINLYFLRQLSGRSKRIAQITAEIKTAKTDFYCILTYKNTHFWAFTAFLVFNITLN
jgi:hypothetical protein